MSETVPNPEYYLVEDWKDYDQGLISTLGSRYFQVQGIQAYSIKTGNPVPNGITNSLPHALSFIKLLKKNISNYPNDYKLNILDLGSGSGIFARCLLKAAQQEGILDRICVLLADLSAKALTEIKQIKVLDEFKEHENYKFIKINILDPESAESLDGEKFTLPKISACTLNYIFDVMPTIILRPAASKGFEKLQFRFLEKNIGQNFKPIISDDELKTNLNYLKNLSLDERWVPYDIQKQNPIQQKYFYLLENENYQQQFAYSYGSLALLESIYALLDDYGFIFCAEMKDNPNQLRPFEIYANCSAHYINEKLISKLATQLGAKRFYSQDHFLQKIIYFKNKNSINLSFLEKEFIGSSSTDLLMDIKQILMNLNSPHSHSIAKIIVEELIKLDPDSAFSLFMQAQSARLSGDQKLFTEKLRAAKEVDFLQDY
jgi:SAM-dependent methyltransferase